MTRTEIINFLIKNNGYKSYLEIGVRDGENYKKIDAPLKIGVDPSCIYRESNIIATTSDDYFSNLAITQKFDIIFIDGLHLDEQATKDISNSLNHLSDNGTVVLHDCNPPDVYHARENFNEKTPVGAAWCGTVWKSIVKVRKNHDLHCYVVDTDYGCGILRKSKNENVLKFDEAQCLEWNFFENNKKKILNLIDTNQFLKLETRK